MTPLGPSAEKYERKQEEWASREASLNDQIHLLQRLLGAVTVRAANVLAVLDDAALEALCGPGDTKAQAKALDTIRRAREGLATAVSDEVIRIAAETAASTQPNGT